MKNRLVGAILVVLGLLTASNALAAEDASQKQELVTKLNEYTIGELERPMMLKHLSIMDMSPAWWTKMQDERGIHALSFFTADCLEFGKRMGWGDAYTYSNSGSGSKEEWKPRIETMLSEWKPKFDFEIKPDTQTCDNMNFDLSMRYLTTIGSVLGKGDWKPASGQIHIVYVPSATAKDITVAKQPDGKIVVKAPINSEPSEWDSKIEKGFKRLANPL